jgi:hypothetical protein
VVTPEKRYDYAYEAGRKDFKKGLTIRDCPFAHGNMPVEADDGRMLLTAPQLSQGWRDGFRAERARMSSTIG